MSVCILILYENPVSSVLEKRQAVTIQAPLLGAISSQLAT